jgi:hypothetical protein
VLELRSGPDPRHAHCFARGRREGLLLLPCGEGVALLDEVQPSLLCKAQEGVASPGLCPGEASRARLDLDKVPVSAKQWLGKGLCPSTLALAPATQSKRKDSAQQSNLVDGRKIIELLEQVKQFLKSFCHVILEQ